MFYEISNIYLSNIRRENRGCKLKTSVNNQQKNIGKYLQNERWKERNNYINDGILNKSNKMNSFIYNTNNKKYSCEKYKSNDNLLHSLIKENQSLKCYLNGMINQSSPKTMINRSEFQRNRINNSINGQI